MPYIGKKPADIIATAVDTTTGDFSGNVTAGGTLGVTGETTLATHLNLGDNDKIKLGASGDLEIFHDGSKSVISDEGTGVLWIAGDSEVSIGNPAVTEYYIRAFKDGAVQLMHDNSTKFATSSGGVTVTGDIANTSGDLTIDVAGDIILDDDGGEVIIKDGGTENNRFIIGGNDAILKSSISNGDLIFKGNDDGSEITALTLDMSDAGTAVFNHDIKIADNNNIQFGAGADLFMFSDGTDGIIDTLNGDLRLRADPNSGASSSMIKFEVDGTEGMRLESGKKLCVGNTDVGVHICRITGNSGGNAVLKVDNSATSGNTTCYLAFMDGSGSASVNSAFFQGFNGANNFYLLGNGTQTFTSDENAKKNIETTRDGYLEDLAKLRVVKYNWKEQEDGEDKELGLIAQEVEKVFPKLVMNDIDPQIEEKDKKKMIKTTVLPFMLLKAVQEANTKITALETENKTQAAQIADLISRVTALESA